MGCLTTERSPLIIHCFHELCTLINEDIKIKDSSLQQQTFATSIQHFHNLQNCTNGAKNRAL